MHIHRIDRNKGPLKILLKVAVGVLMDSQKFSGHQYILYNAHHAVIFAVAQLSCYNYYYYCFMAVVCSAVKQDANITTVECETRQQLQDTIS